MRVSHLCEAAIISLFVCATGALAENAPGCRLVPRSDGNITATQGCLDQILAEPSSPKRASMAHELAYTLNERGSFEVAAAFLDLALSIEPDNPRYRQERGYSRTNLGQLNEALVDLDAAVRLDPNLGLAVGQRAFVKYKLGDYSGALEDYDRVIELDGEKLDYLFGRANSLILLGRFSEALEDMSKIEKLPHSTAVMTELTNLMIEKLGDRANTGE
jgi:tetratricopeptide (TPR) repeat protein